MTDSASRILAVLWYCEEEMNKSEKKTDKRQIELPRRDGEHYAGAMRACDRDSSLSLYRGYVRWNAM